MVRTNFAAPLPRFTVASLPIVESTNQQSSSAENHSNEADSDDDSDGEMNSHRSLSTKASTTSLWKRKTTTSNASTLNVKRKCVTNSDYSSSDQRDRKKPAQRNATVNTQNSLTGNGKKIKLNNESSSTPSDEPTYCLCSQVSASPSFTSQSTTIFSSRCSSPMVP